MRAAIFRLLLVLLLAASAAACGALPKGLGKRPSADQLYLQSMEEAFTSRPGNALETLRHDYPDSPWTASAQAIAELNKTRELQEVRIQALQKEKNQLQQENRKLKEDLEKLRKLVIETERRRK